MWFRAFVMLGVVALGAPALGGCRKKQARPFSCDRYQKRMERCENYVLAALKDRYEADVRTGSLTADQAEARFKTRQWQLRRRIRYKNSGRLCRKLQSLQTPYHRKRFSTMKYCFRHKGCVAFAECMRALW